MNFVPQHDQMDCAPACLCMIASAYGKKYPLQYLRDNSFITREGVSLLGITEASKKIGFDALSTKLDIDVLRNEKEAFPCILHWNQNHFVVLRKITKNLISSKYSYHISDPAYGNIKLDEKKFISHWISDTDKGIAVFLEPSKNFHDVQTPPEEKISFKFLLKHLKNYRKQLSLMFLMLLLGSLITLTFPFLTQSLIDKGINAKDLNIITILLLAQLSLFLGSITIEVIRNWLMLSIGTHLSISIISDFLKKLLYLPIKFFDSKMMGDFNQRIQDNERIEQFLTSQSLLTFFSMITFAVFFGVLWYYDFKILVVYTVLTIAALGWSTYWLKRRKLLDYFRFQEKSRNQESIYEMINGVTEMKINQLEDYKLREWHQLQSKLFSVNKRILKIDQIQIAGFDFLNQLKNIVVTFLAATFVVHGKMTLGELLGVSYIVGQMNSPVNQLVSFFRSFQDAKLSFERLNEVQNQEAEEQSGQINIESGFDNNKEGIKLNNVSFQYEGSNSEYVLRGINLLFPEGKITAIVGASGSGKTTLMKLLLKFYKPTQGSINLNGIDLEKLSAKSIRQNSGVVMQDGFIFSDSIERNIATGDKEINQKMLEKAIHLSNIDEFIKSLPLKSYTKVGASGNGISGGQKQRILIARAVYKNPKYIFFDEATSALDSENEKIIHDNLKGFFKDKTAVIIAHRLSTVKNADKIIVLKKGKVIEEGKHQELVDKKGEYFNLIKNQLELGN